MRSWRLFWSELPIKKKLLLFFFVMISCISLLNLYTLTNSFRYLDLFGQELLRNSEIHRFQGFLSASRHALEEYVKERKESLLEEFQGTPGQMRETWTLIDRHARTSREAGFQINALRYGLIAYLESSRRILEAEQQGRSDIRELARFRRIYGYMDEYLESLLQIRLNEGIALHSSNIRIINRVQGISTVGLIVITVSFFLFGVAFSESLTKPLRRLAANSRMMAAGKLDVPKPSYSHRDEIGTLVEAFYGMSGNIHDMVESLKEKREIERKLHEDELQIVEMKKSLREARFLNLQSQINPHFLFNTLNTISRMSLFEGAPKSVRLIESLARVFRHSLDTRSPIVTLREELAILREYVHIQETRFGSRLRFSIACGEGCQETELPVFTLQPLVENAIKHGIEPKEEGGEVRIGAELREDGRVCILVEDSGVGIAPERLERLNRGEGRGDGAGGIGVVNVRRRLSLAYREESRFVIEERPGGGTRIAITLPAGYKCIEF